jgi:hypothetical protein
MTSKENKRKYAGEEEEEATEESMTTSKKLQASGNEDDNDKSSSKEAVSSEEEPARQACLNDSDTTHSENDWSNGNNVDRDTFDDGSDRNNGSVNESNDQFSDDVFG